jgi:DNA-binding MarR family transcriptional regulator
VSIPVRASLLGLLARAEHRATARLEAALRGEDLSTEQWRVLSLLADGGGHPMSEIAGYAMVPAPTLTKIVDRLIDRTLVYRRVDSVDRRRVLVFLSDRGAELYARLDVAVDAAERELAEVLGEPDAIALTELLLRLLERLDRP